MKYLSLFSGIGGFELGIGNRGGCIGYSEIDKYAIKVYEKHFPTHKNYGDITKIIASQLPEFDLLCGGFPCQSFSIAGKRGGFQDTRGTLFFDIARIIKEKRPSYLFLENVKGLLNHNQGNTFATIISTLDELGYDCQWSVLNSKNFGVPQNRERVFIIGHLRGKFRPKVFPFGEADKRITEGEQTISRKVQTKKQETNSRYNNSKVLQDGKNGYIHQINQPKHSNDRIYGQDGIAPTLNTMQGGRRQPKIVASRGRNPRNPSDRKTGSPTEQRLEENSQGITNTLTNVQKDNWLLEGSRIRRLTPLECERLQGFPDDWTKFGREKWIDNNREYTHDNIPISDTQRYKMCGNAVTVNVIKAIAEKLL